MDLAEVYTRLVDRGLVKRAPSLVIRWGASNRTDYRIGHSSVLMKTIIVNPKLDTENITENALDYALYMQIYRVNLGFSGDREDDACRYESMIAEYPERMEAETEVGRLGLNL